MTKQESSGRIAWRRSRRRSLNLKVGDVGTDAVCEQAYRHFAGNALYDDRADRAGAKFADADLMGHPWQIVVGPRGAAAGHGGVEAARDRGAAGGYIGSGSGPDGWVDVRGI